MEPIRATDEYAELEGLRKAALVQQKMQKAKEAQRKKRPRIDLLKMILWKNLTIRKRRKTQYILLLFQVLLWFSVACFSIVWRSGKYMYKHEPNPGLTQLVPRLRPENFQHPIGIAYNRALDAPLPVPHSQALEAAAKGKATATAAAAAGSSDLSTGDFVVTELSLFQKNLVEVFKGFLNYFKLTYDGYSPPLRLFKNIDSLVLAMREDKRIPFGLNFDKLDLDQGLVSYELLFWQKEVPVDEFDRFDCRVSDSRLGGASNCGMKLYGKYGFTLAQAAISTAILEALGKRHGLVKESIIVPKRSREPFKPEEGPAKVPEATTNTTGGPAAGAGVAAGPETQLDSRLSNSTFNDTGTAESSSSTNKTAIPSGESFVEFRSLKTDSSAANDDSSNSYDDSSYVVNKEDGPVIVKYSMSSDQSFIETNATSKRTDTATSSTAAAAGSAAAGSKTRLQEVMPSNKYRIELPGVAVVAERFPEHQAIRSQAKEIAPTAPFYFMFALVSVFSFVVMDLVMEKESKMKEVMKTYGLSSGMFWLSWLVTYAMLNIIIVWCAIFVCTIGGVFGPVTSIVVVALLIYIYLLSMITLAFMISVFFQRAQTATIAGMVFNIFLYALGSVIHQTRTSSYLIRGFAHLFSTITFSLSIIDLISMIPEDGVTLSRLFNFHEHSIGLYIIIMFVDMWLYFGFAWYLDQVAQSDWGSTKPWTFVFEYLWKKLIKHTEWGRRKAAERMLMQAEEDEKFIEDTSGGVVDAVWKDEWVEPVANEIKQRGSSVRVRNLVKKFPGKEGIKTVVDNLSLDVYAGEIFGLLGHNGAGKTTTISMLTGMLQSDGGDSTIMGHSIIKEPEEARKLISVCPQQNLFFEDLTCLEHFIFFAALRGIDVSEGIEQASNSAYFFDLIVQKRFLAEQRGRIVDAIANIGGVTEGVQRTGIVEMEKHFNRFGLSLFTDPDIHYRHIGGRTLVSANTWPGILAAVEKVGLSEKMFNFPRMLSGGMKRRLWLALALVGDPKVVFLDEPTSGVDPLGRQELWRLIQDEKVAGRCIIITTHHMEEADILADRKAILTSGRLRCVGTSLFLKSRFGIGYYLEVEIAPNYSLAAAEESVLEFIRRFVPGAKSHKSEKIGTAMTMAAAKRNTLLFQLPIAALDSFAELFDQLDAQKVSLNITEYGVSMSTLEEVFFKLGEEEELAQVEAEDAAAKEEEAPPLSPLGVYADRRPSSLFPSEREQEVDQLSSRRHHQPSQQQSLEDTPSTTELISHDQLPEEQTQGRVLKHGTPGDLVSQKFSKTNPTSIWKLLLAVISLRFVQITHNKLNFTVDVLFPVLMLTTSLFFRDTGTRSLDLIKAQDAVPVAIDSYSSVLNSTIPFAIDERLVGPGLTEARTIIRNLPVELRKLLKKVDVLSSELIQYDFGGDEAGLQSSGGAADDMGLSVSQLTPDSLTMGSSIGDTPVYGRAVRNYLWAKRDPIETPIPVYSAGLSFEPRSAKINSLEGDPHRLQIRIFYDAGLFHALPMLLSALTDSIMASKLNDKFSSTGSASSSASSSAASTITSTVTAKSVMLDTQSQDELHKSRWHTNVYTAPLFMDIPLFVTAMTYRMYIMLSLGLSSLPSRFGIQIMLDKFTGTKHAIIVMGLPFTVYWLGSFVMNYLAMLFGNLIVCGFIAYFIPMFWGTAILPVLFCAVFYSASVLLWAYFLSQLFNNLKAYAMTLQFMGMLLALCPAYLVSVFSDAGSSGAGSAYTTIIIHLISSLLLPPYNPIGVLLGCAIVCGEGLHRGRPSPFSAYFSFSKLPIYSVIASAIQAVALFSGTTLVDRWQYNMKSKPPGAEELLEGYYRRRTQNRNEWLRRRNGNQNLIPASLQDHKDEDVLSEEFECMKIHRILKGQERLYKNCKTSKERELLCRKFQMTAQEDSLFPRELPLILIDDLHYLFFPRAANQPPHVAVRGFSLQVYRGEIFGLLGPNGAGKTTSINLLTCNYRISAPTKGTAFLGGHDVIRDPTAAFTHLGLCPQFDALWQDVNVRDNLRIFARIKNIPESELEAVLDKFIEDLELQTHQHKRVQECSGGNKRRVSVAVSFMGKPDVVLMDEPSSGIDPVGRRRLAEMIHRESKQRCVLITTHSMEEAEAICSRIGIIVNGELNCLNTSLAIRNRYGAGIRLEVILDDTSPKYVGFDSSNQTMNPWQLFLHQRISENAVEIDRVANRITYDIPLKSNNLGHLFGLMEANKANYAVKDYALSQPTLDQVFITFAKRQKSAQETVQEIFRG